MKFKPCSHNSDKGFTIVELLVAMTLGLLMAGMSLTMILSNRSLYQYDLARTRLNQNLRNSLDIVGANVREAGENLQSSFPALEIINGGDNPDELIVRRSHIDEILKLCQPIASGSGSLDVFFAYAGEEPGCTYSDQVHNYTVWRQYRLDHGGSVRAFIYDPSTTLGEFFDYTTEVDTGTTMLIRRGSGSWTNNYEVGTAAVYLIEEWRFRISEDINGEKVLQIIENGQTASPMNVMYGITALNVSAELQDNSTVSSLGPQDGWTLVKAVEVTIAGEERDRVGGGVIERSLTSRFFPRNILSH